MLLNMEDQDDPSLGTFDVVVVGAGAVGLPLSVKLARAGLRVATLEAGSLALSVASQAVFEAARSVGKAHDGLRTGRFRMLGGTSNFWGGQLVPIDDHVFAPRPWLGEAGWPIKRTELDVPYQEALDILGLAHALKTDAEVMRKLRIPLPDLGPSLDYFFTRWAPTPVLQHHFDDDIANLEHLHVYYNAEVDCLGLPSPDGRVDDVRLRDAKGRRFTIGAKTIVLANGTIEVARLLLDRTAGDVPAPWADNPWIGRGFTDHLDVNAGTLELRDKKLFDAYFQNILLGGAKYQPKIKLNAEAQQQLGTVDIGCHLIFNSSYEEHLANAKTFVRSFLRGRPDSDWKSYPARLRALVRVGIPMIARYLRDNRIYAHADRGIDLRLSCEHIAVRDSRLVASGRTDPSGRLVHDLAWHIDGREIETMAVFAEMVGTSLERAGIATLHIDERLSRRDPAFADACKDTNHQMGMARMGKSPDDGVVDTDLRVFGTSNLYVASAAVFPSTGFPNPTLTAIALAMRLGNHLLNGGDHRE